MCNSFVVPVLSTCCKIKYFAYDYVFNLVFAGNKKKICCYDYFYLKSGRGVFTTKILAGTVLEVSPLVELTTKERKQIEE